MDAGAGGDEGCRFERTTAGKVVAAESLLEVLESG